MPHRPTLFGVKIGIKGKRANSAKDTNTNEATTNTPSQSKSQNEAASTTTVDSAPSTPERMNSVGSQQQQLPQKAPPVIEIDIDSGDGMSTESCHDSDMTGTSTEKKKESTTNTAMEEKMSIITSEKRKEMSDEPKMILIKDEETSWQAPNASAATSVERKVLKIEGDDSPPFRNYKKENTQRSTSTFKARPLPNMTAPPSIPPTRYGATQSSSDLPHHQQYNGPDVPLGRNISLYRLADDNQSVSSARSAGKSIRSGISQSARSFQARPMPKFNEAPKVPIKQQRGPVRSEWTVKAKWETADQ